MEADLGNLIHDGCPAATGDFVEIEKGRDPKRLRNSTLKLRMCIESCLNLDHKTSSPEEWEAASKPRSQGRSDRSRRKAAGLERVEKVGGETKRETPHVLRFNKLLRDR